MRLNPENHITIEIRPYSAERRARHKHGATHLVRIIERKASFPGIDQDRAGYRGDSDGNGKIENILEQEICDIASSLRRYGDWQRPPRKSRAKKKRSGLGDRGEVGGGHGSGADYREA